MAVASHVGPVSEFCAQLDELRIESGAEVPALARQLDLSRAQLYAILGGRIKRPPDWDQVVRPVVDACTGGDPGALAAWRRRHAVLTGLWAELRRHERQLGGAGDSTQPRRRARAIPRQLPATVRHFTGRSAELDVLNQLLGEPSGDTPGTAVISAIGGTAGVGKTALALAWAHQVADRFPDGQLYVNLHGYGPNAPVPAEVALASLLGALGLPAADIPARAEERAAAYRTLLASQTMLIMLDNAAHVDQVRPLLPATSSCVTLVTSRSALAGLVARDGAMPVMLGLLPLTDAVALLRRLIGERAVTDPEATAELARLCARLPLALRVAAQLATARPGVPLAALVAEFEQRQDCLDLLDTAGDDATAVREVFSWSLRHVNVTTADAFSLAALHPGQDIDTGALAALAGTTLAEAERLLVELAQAHLVQPVGDCRYSLHDLLRAYGRELSARDVSGKDTNAALNRLLDYYLMTAAAATEILYPAEAAQPIRTERTAGALLALKSEQTARAWLDAELPNLISSSSYAADNGCHRHAIRLSQAMFRYLQDTCRYPEAALLHGHAHRAAIVAGDRAAEARALDSLGAVDLRQGRYKQGARNIRQALACWREVGDQTGQIRALKHLGMIDFELERFEIAARYFRGALAIARQTRNQAAQARMLASLGAVDVQLGRYARGNRYLRQSVTLSRDTSQPTVEAYALSFLGNGHMWQGNWAQAESYLRLSLVMCRQTTDRAGESFALASLGNTHLQQNCYDQAERDLQESLAICRQIGYPTGEGLALTYLGDAHSQQHRLDSAASCLHQALVLFRGTGDLGGQADALNGLGELHLALGDPGLAVREHAAALELATRIKNARRQARAHAGIGRCHRSTGDRTLAGQDRHTASDHLQQALAIYAQLKAPEADDLRAELALTDSPEPASLQ